MIQIGKFSGAVGGIGNLLLMSQGGDLAHADTMDSLTMFGREVLPQIQGQTPSPLSARVVAAG